jgi:ATP-binding cassette subfamily B protein
MNSFVQEHLLGISIIRSFGLQAQEKKKFEEINEDYQTANVESVYNFSFFIAGIEFLQNLVLILVFAVLGVTAISTNTEFQAGTYFTLTLYALMIFRPIGDLAERYNVLQSAVAAARRIFNILDVKPEPSFIGNPLPNTAIEEILFEDVWFAYQPDNWVLKGVSFRVKKGESVALVGITGAGKTTIVNLLLRFYEIQRGSIKINGIDIRTLSLETLRRAFSVVLQDPFIFSGTVRDNIALYQSSMTDDAIEKVVTALGLNSFLERFPDGFDQMLEERGAGLSAGEAQLLSLLRAMVQNRPILILDEATANIDSQMEKVIQDTMDKVLPEKTSLIIAHRLSTIQRATCILVMNQGIIVESGTHEELLHRQGLYAKLHKLQMLES